MKTRSSFVSNSSSTSFVLSFKEGEVLFSGVEVESLLSRFGKIECEGDTKGWETQQLDDKIKCLKRFLPILVKNKDNTQLLSFLTSNSLSDLIYGNYVNIDVIKRHEEHYQDYVAIEKLSAKLKEEKEKKKRYDDSVKGGLRIVTFKVDNMSDHIPKKIIYHLVDEKKMKIIEVVET